MAQRRKNEQNKYSIITNVSTMYLCNNLRDFVGVSCMNRLEKAKQIIKENIDSAQFGIFDTGSLSGDERDVLYKDEELTILICYHWSYFEVYGLTKKEFKELNKYYVELGGWSFL